MKIRLNTDPSPWQMLNCKNWQNNTVAGCVRAVYNGDPITVEIPGVQQNSMYLLYYMPANEYPFRPVAGYTVYRESIVTMNWGFMLTLKGFILILGLMIMVFS